VRVLLDTQVLLALAIEGLAGVPIKVRTLLEDSDTDRVLSTVSITEIAIKNSIGRTDRVK
jgi:PIN domain nuclease of toxin-antitoxin system